MNNNIIFSSLLIFSIMSFFLTEQSWAQSAQNIIISAGSSDRGCEQNKECFIPNIFEVELGDTVVWINEDTETHFITSGTTSFGPDGKFKSDTINPGETFSVTFEEGVLDTGTYFYYDAEYFWMEGIIIVQEQKTVEETSDNIDPTPIENDETDMTKPEDNLNSENEIDDESSADQQSEEGGGCLIATATYGSELSTQVQMLRELRDNAVLSTTSGTTFMTGFNQFYYSFSPTIADWERQVPFFKDTVKVLITPLLTSLSLLSLFDIDSETEVVGFGIGIISLNAAIYFVIPFLTFFKIKQRISLKNRC